MKRVLIGSVLFAGCYFINVSPQANNPPTAGDLSLTTAEDTPLTIPIADLIAVSNDIDGDALSLQGTPIAINGTIAFANNNQDLIFTPNQDLNGSVTFSYIVTDGEADSSPGTVTITVTSVEDDPVATPLSVSVVEDTPKNFTLTGFDPDDVGAAVTVNTPTTPSAGTITGTAPNFVYTPDPNFNGADSAQFTVTSNGITSAPAIISFTVSSVNDKPVASNVTGAVIRGGQTVTIAPVVVDPDGDAVSIQLSSQPLQGNAAIVGNQIEYTSDDSFVGTVIFSYTATDNGQPAQTSLSASVTITVNQACGDGVVDVGEECDDQNQIADDGCEANCTLTCASGFAPDNVVATPGGSCYALFRDVRTFATAEAFCAANGGGHLAAITSAQENAFIDGQLLNATDSPWLGGTDAVLEATFLWTTGEGFDPFGFAAGQPNNANNNEDCVHMLTDGTWDDTDCNNPDIDPTAGTAFVVNALICEF